MRWMWLSAALFLLGGLSFVRVAEATEASVEQRLRMLVRTGPLFDTHEHLSPYADLKRRDRVDFRLLFEPYVVDCLRSAGMPMDLYEQALAPGLTPARRFSMFAPYWPAVRSTAAGLLAERAAWDLYGVAPIDAEHIEALSEAMDRAYRTRDMVAEGLRRAGIDKAVLDLGMRRPPAGGLFLHAERYEEFVHVHNFDHMRRMAAGQGVELKGFDDYLQAMEKAFAGGLARKMVAVKSALGYHRPLDYGPGSRAEALKVYERLRREPARAFPFPEVRPLQDFMMAHLLGLCQRHKMPVQIHTGLLTGSGKPISRSDPALLTGIFDRFPGVDFMLLHGGYPFGGQLAAVVKNHANAYLDLSWLFGLSPAYAERYLHEWLDLIPANKIMVFGGDAIHVEWTFAQAAVMREVLEKVLVARLRDGRLAEDQALELARGLMRDNARAFFRQDGLLPLHRRPVPRIPNLKRSK